MKSSIGFLRIGGWLFYAFVLFFGSFLCYVALAQFSFNEPVPLIILLLGLALCGIGFFCFVWDRRHIYALKLDDEKIIIGKRGTFYWANLEQADVHARYKGAGNNYRNVIILKFKNEEPIYLFNYGYGNISHIRTYITSKINEPMK